MTKQTIEVQGLPKGNRAVAFREPLARESYMDADGVLKIAPASWGKGCSIPPRLIIEKIQPRRIVANEREHNIALMEGAMNKASDDYFKARPQLDSELNLRIFQAGFDRAWKQVKETDLSLNSDEPKLTLSVDECRQISDCNPVDVVLKVREFLEKNS
jgi:hypothetical protein